jgi:preprotein translocase subunit SecA
MKCISKRASRGNDLAMSECEAEELYPPKSWMDLVRGRWTRDMTFRLVDQASAYWGKPQPVSIKREPGRNEHCPCGSGKKYKKCCLGAPREQAERPLHTR